MIASLLISAGVANNLRSLEWGFLYDDYAHQLFLRYPDAASPASPCNLYDWGSRPEPGDPSFEAGAFPWWTSADFKVRFFRPVASLSILLDYALYDDQAVGYHVTSLLLYAVFLAMAFALYRELGAPGDSALWALAFLALDDAHFLPVGWIANRNTILASLFTVAAVWGVHRYRRFGNRGPLAWAIACFLLACGSKESALAAYPTIVLYLLLFERREPREKPTRATTRLMRSGTFWTFTILAGGFLMFYLSAGYGARSEAYPMPWGDPMEYFGRLAILVPTGLLGLFFSFPVDAFLHSPQIIPLTVLVGLSVMTAAGIIWFRVVRFSRLSVLALGWILFSLLTEAGGDFSDRLLMNASIGSSLLIGLFLDRLRPWRDRFAERRYASLVLAGIWLVLGIVVSVPATALRSSVWLRLGAGDRDAIMNAPIDLRVTPPRDVFLLNSPSSLMALTMPYTWLYQNSDLGTRIFPLQFKGRPLTWRRDDDKSMTLSSEAGPFCTGRFERVFRADRSVPPAGFAFVTAAFSAVVGAVENTGFRTVHFRFTKSLDDESYLFLVWRAGELAAIAPPAVGQTVSVPEVPPVKLAP